MVREGWEYGRRRRESEIEENDETHQLSAREIVDEIRRDIESRESQETDESSERTDDIEEHIRKAIEKLEEEEKEEQLEAPCEEPLEKTDKDDYDELEKKIDKMK